MKSLSELIGALIAAVVIGINTHRSDADAIAKQKAESDAVISDLQAKLAEAQPQAAEEGKLEELRSQIEDALTQAQAAKPPLPEHVDEVESIPAAPVDPAPAPAQAANTGDGSGAQG